MPRRALLGLALLAVLAVLAGPAGLALAEAGGASAAATNGTVTTNHFRSSAVGGTLRFDVYLPAGYAGTTRRYPVIYLLGGLPSTGRTLADSRIRAVGRIAERRGHPAIVVTPQASRPGDTDPEYHDWGKGRNWETVISHELVATVDQRFRTIASRPARALIGISAGGYGAAIIAVHHPATFAQAQAWSGYFVPTNPAGTARLSVGSAAANRRASVHSYITALRGHTAPRLDFYVGNRDPDFVPENQKLHRELVHSAVPHRFALYRGAHTGALWTAHQDDWVSTLVARLP